MLRNISYNNSIIKSEINEVVEKAVDFAESSDEPDISELDKDIYKK